MCLLWSLAGGVTERQEHHKCKCCSDGAFFRYAVPPRLNHNAVIRKIISGTVTGSVTNDPPGQSVTVAAKTRAKLLLFYE